MSDPIPPVITFRVTNLLDTNTFGTFRYAINQTNTSFNFSFIVFDVKGIIKLTSDLPKIKKICLINGTNVPSFVAPTIEIDCNGYRGLVLDCGANNCTIIGLSVTNSKYNGILIKSNGNSIIQCYIGVDINGNVKGNQGNGILICGGNANVIGANPLANSGLAPNVISGNRENGIALFRASGNTIQANFIGTDSTGLKSYPNNKNGIFVNNYSLYNQIGGTIYTNSQGVTNNPSGSKGTVPIVNIFPPLGNLISGNIGNGVLISGFSNNNTLNGNFIGTDVSGVKALGNSSNGVFIDGSTNNQLIGCTTTENPFVYYNVCSGNALNGIYIYNSTNITVQGNFFGCAANNASTLPNGYNGISVGGSSANIILGGPIPLGNVCAGNMLSGVSIDDFSAFTTNYNNFCGLYAFGGPAGNKKNGITITSPGFQNLITTCVTSGNGENGIELSGKCSNVTIATVISGLDTKGQALMPNGKHGLLIKDSANNIVIGTREPSVIPRATFSGNTGNGIYITDSANNVQVNLTFIGLNSSGQNTSLGNKLDGIRIDGNANKNFVGVSTASRDFTNFVSANNAIGIELTGNSSNNTVQYNYVGIAFDGTPAPNKLGQISNTSSQSSTNIVQNNITP